jgi:hypothetical protein
MRGSLELHLRCSAAHEWWRCASFCDANGLFQTVTSDDQSNISSSPQIGPEPTSVTTAGIIRSGHLPRPELGIIGEIERAIKTLARTQTLKERICEYIQQEVSIYFHMTSHSGLWTCRIPTSCQFIDYDMYPNTDS